MAPVFASSAKTVLRTAEELETYSVSPMTIGVDSFERSEPSCSDVGELQLADVGRGDLLQRAVAGVGVVAAVHRPLPLVLAQLAQVVIGQCRAASSAAATALARVVARCGERLPRRPGSRTGNCPWVGGGRDVRSVSSRVSWMGLRCVPGTGRADLQKNPSFFGE